MILTSIAGCGCMHHWALDAKQLYTPNTGKSAVMEESTLQPTGEDDTIEPEDIEDDIWAEDTEVRGVDYIKLKNGKFAGSRPSGGKKTRKPKYAPSPQRNKDGIQLGAKRYARLCGTLGTYFPNLQKGEIRTIRDTSYVYEVKADGYGGFTALKITKLK